MDYKDNLPIGYLKRRKTADLLFIFSAYLYCLAHILLQANVIMFNDYNIYTVYHYSFCLICVGFLVYCFGASRRYKNIIMHNHREIKAFSKKEKILYAIPIAISSAIIPFDMITFFLMMGLAYVMISQFNKPVEAYEKENFHM